MLVKINFVLPFILLAGLSQAQTLSNILPISSSGYDHIYASALDSEGNLYVSAVLATSGSNESFNLHDSFFNNNPMPAFGSLLIKFDISRQVVWVKGFDWINAMAIDDKDNLYVAGSRDKFNLMVAKINSNGEILWKLTERATGLVWAEDIIVDNQGSCFVTGNANSWSLFGLSFASRSCCGSHDFLIKLDTNGKLLWVRASAQDSYTHGRALAFTPQGNVVVGGTFSYKMDLSSFSLTSGVGYENVYFAEFSSGSGAVMWLDGFGGSGSHTLISDLAVDDTGNFYICGAFTGNASIQNNIVVSAGEYDFFIAKLSQQRTVSWIKSIGTDKRDKADYLIKTSDGVIVSGVVGANASLDRYQLNDVDKPKAIIARIKSSGEIEWLKSLGYTSNDNSSDISFRRGYTLNAVSDNCFIVAGDFAYDLVAPERTLSAPFNDINTLTNAFTGIISTGNELPPDLGPDIDLTWCDSSTVKIGIKPTPGTNHWLSEIGTLPAIDDSEAGAITLSNLGYGQTNFKLVKGTCATSEQNFSLNRLKTPEIPMVHNPYEICSNELGYAEIVIEGSSITWYSSEQSGSIISIGNTFKPTEPATLYVTSTNQICESAPAPVSIVVIDKPEPPLDATLSLCIEMPGAVITNINDLKYYESETSTEPIGAGSNLAVDVSSIGNFVLFVTQTVNGCESERARIDVGVSMLNEKEIKLSNVITANDDGLNDSFYMPSFSSEMCLGEFRFVKISNRWGNEVFFSKDRNFVWRPGDLKSGVYYYSVSFDLRDFRSSITVFR